MEDAERFAELFKATGGKPTTEQLQAAYLSKMSSGVKFFIPSRIEDAAHLSAAITEDPAAYEHAIRDCLPHIREHDSDLRSIYLALHGLYPDKALPEVYVLFGAGNSGGTAGPNAQVIGLEVICKTASTPDALRSTLRGFFAHETVHTFTRHPEDLSHSPLLFRVLDEGAADFVAEIVTGEPPDPLRAQWAASREADLWTQLHKDILTVRNVPWSAAMKSEKDAVHRWIWNYGAAPTGWPSEVGYWMGMQIWQCYYKAMADKHQAMHDVIEWTDPNAILLKSAYKGSNCNQE